MCQWRQQEQQQVVEVAEAEHRQVVVVVVVVTEPAHPTWACPSHITCWVVLRLLLLLLAVAVAAAVAWLKLPSATWSTRRGSGGTAAQPLHTGHHVIQVGPDCLFDCLTD